MKQYMVIILTVSLSTSLMAQNMNPYGLNGPSFDVPTFADIDKDGDLDAFGVSLNQSKGTIIFWENIGTANTPDFKKGEREPFGLASKVKSSPIFADIDQDGDLDVFAALQEGQGPGKIVFWENKGSAQKPLFKSKIKEPFGITSKSKGAPALADIDQDNQKEIFWVSASGAIFFKNREKAEKPAFGSKQKAPFGLEAHVKSTPVFVDFDSDGDLDAFSINKKHEILYWKNEGTKENPAFAEPEKNPFNLQLPSKGAPAVIDIKGSDRLEILGVRVNEKSGTIFQYQPGK